MKIPSNIKGLSNYIYQRYHDQYRMLRIDCSDFKKIPSDNDFMINDPIKITKTNSFRVAGIILVLSYFTHYANAELVKAR